MADNVTPSRATWRSRAFRRFAILLVIAWMIDHRGCVHWDRPRGGYSRTTAYIHREGDGYRLSRTERGNCGEVAYIRAAASNDRNLFNTRAWEWRWLGVTLEGRQLDRAEVRAWRPAAAGAFMTPSILLGDVDESRRYRLGYPLEVVGVIAATLALVVAPICLLALAAAGMNSVERSVANRFDPNLIRRRLLREGVCPICRYSLRGLPTNRCPECGEGWSDWELLERSPQEQGSG